MLRLEFEQYLQRTFTILPILPGYGKETFLIIPMLLKPPERHFLKPSYTVQSPGTRLAQPLLHMSNFEVGCELLQSARAGRSVAVPSPLPAFPSSCRESAEKPGEGAQRQQQRKSEQGKHEWCRPAALPHAPARARSVRARTARTLPKCTFAVAACTCIMHVKPRAMMLLYSTTFSFTRKRETATALRGAETGHEAFMRLL